MKKVSHLLLKTTIAVISYVLLMVMAAPASSSDIETSTSGGGHYVVAGALDVQFAFFASQHKDAAFQDHFTSPPMTRLGFVDR